MLSSRDSVARSPSGEELEKGVGVRDSQNADANAFLRSPRISSSLANDRRLALTGLAERKHAEEAFRALVGTAGINVDAAFFRETVRGLCTWIGVDCAIISELVNGNRVQALAMQLDGQAIAHYDYALPGTPCEQAVQKGYCEYHEGVVQLFPGDQDLVDMRAEAYIGMSIRDNTGKVIGIICALSRHKFVPPPMVKDVLEIIAARAGAEIERNHAEQAFRDSLAEKEVLMREIHHRVKNNLQMMSALLELQSRYVKDEQVLGFFKDSQQRIQSMALIHEQLYHNQNIAQIDFAAYLRNLVDNLYVQYSERCRQVKIRIETKPCTLPVDTAIPCGLVVNELVSNAMKHAFPNGRAGELRITLKCGIGGSVVLEVADDGVGLSAGTDIHNGKSFGMRVVTLMVEKQLHGKLTVESNHGTSVICEIGESK